MVKNPRFDKHTDLASQEIKYFYESFFSNQKLMQFLMVSWNLSSGFLGIYSRRKLSTRQKIGLSFLVKSARLLRSTTKLAGSGYWPEAKIIQRSHVELQALLIFLFKDRSNSRLNKWLRNTNPSNNVWPWRDISKDLLGIHEFNYSFLSQATHSHVFSFHEIFQFNEGKPTIYIGPSPSRKKRELETLLAMSALLNGGVVELVADLFPQNPRTYQALQNLYALPQYKKIQSEMKKRVQKKAKESFFKALQQPKIKGIGKRFLYRSDTVL